MHLITKLPSTRQQRNLSIFKSSCHISRRVASGGQGGGQCPQIFVFGPPDFFLALPRYFFGRKKLLFLGGKNVKICDFGQKQPSDFGEDLFFSFLFFCRSPAFGRKVCDFGQKKPSDQRRNRSGFSRPDPTGKFQNHRRLTGF